MRLFALIIAAVLLAASPFARAQEPPKPSVTPAQPNPALPKLPVPPSNGSMSVVSAQAIADKGKLILFVMKNEPVTTVEKYTFTEQVPVKVLVDDGKGGKVEKTESKQVTKEGTRNITKYVSVMKQYPVTGNDNLTVTDATGKKLSDDEVRKALEKPVFAFEFTDKPNTDFLKTLKPETVVLAWKPVQHAPAAVPGGGLQPAPSTVPPPASVPPPAKPKGEFEPSATEQDVIDRTNAERKKEGLPALAASPKLIQAARSHSANMARQGVLAHTLDEKTANRRVTDAGYKWTRSGENIAQGQRTPEEAVTAWMNSPGHRGNILTNEYTEIGVAVVEAKDGQKYWTMVLASDR
jgi:uncharacterized protein YkwD